MSSLTMKRLKGFVGVGTEVPWMNPHEIRIVGRDVKETATNWVAFCPRLDEPLEPEWVEDIRTNGVRQAVDVYKDGDTVVLLEGRRRVGAARIVWDEQKKADVPEKDRIKVRVTIRTGDSEDLFGFNVGSENRKPRTPLQRAQLMQHAQKYGSDDASLSKMFGCTVQTVKNTIAIFSLERSLQKAVDTGEFPLREALKLVSLPRDEQKAKFEELKAAGATKGARAANGISAAKKGEKVDGADKTKMRPRAFLEKWVGEFQKIKVDDRPKVDPAVVLRFVLGKALPSELADDDVIKATLEKAGFKMKKKEKE